MQLNALSRRKLLMKDFLVESVQEGITARHSPIRPLGNARRGNNLPFPDQSLASLLHVRNAAIEASRHSGCGKFRAGRARRFEKLLVFGVQAIDLARDHLPQGARDVLLLDRFPGWHTPVSVDFKDLLLCDEIVDERDDEQGLPSGTPEHPPGQHLRNFGVIEP